MPSANYAEKSHSRAQMAQPDSRLVAIPPVRPIIRCMRGVLASFLIGTVLIAVVGCRAPQPPQEPTFMMLRIPDYEAFVDQTLTLLRERDFPPERVDRDAGLIVSQPTTSGQWYEFWREDSQGGYQIFESSICTMQRVVTIRSELAGPPPQPEEIQAGSFQDTAPPLPATFRVSVQVDKYRYSAPDRQITTASGAIAIYSEKIPTAEGLRKLRTKGAHWIPKGRDGLLEAHLLAKIAAMPQVEPVE